jgi:hypothetical protein
MTWCCLEPGVAALLGSKRTPQHQLTNIFNFFAFYSSPIQENVFFVLTGALKRGCDWWCHAGTDLAGGVYVVIYEFVMFLYYRFICILSCEFLDILMGDAVITNTVISPLGDGDSHRDYFPARGRDGEKTSPVSFHGDGEFIAPRSRGWGAIPQRVILRCHFYAAERIRSMQLAMQCLCSLGLS